jgi:serine phosphatase RsbU (regulator of sigma subunit)/ABC-type transporter Mla MlaB component
MLALTGGGDRRMKAPIPENETQRLRALESYAILDTLPEQAYDDITYLASQICDTPIAVVSLVDRDRQWFKSKVGLDVDETPRDLAFCAHAILAPDTLLIVEDATSDDRFSDNPLVTTEPKIRFYAGSPLVTSDGQAIGTLCVIDRKPRGLSAEQQKTLAALSRQVVTQLELRRSLTDLHNRTDDLAKSNLALEQRTELVSKSRDELADLVDLLENQAELIQRDLKRAEIIQRSLLPQEVPQLKDFNVCSLYRPGHTVGGDLYDVIVIDNRYLALVIADASGHGVSAAMLSVLFKNEIRLQDPGSGIPYRPGWALARINASLCENQPAPGVFLTAAYCLLDIEERSLVIASAGHPPILHLHNGGQIDEINHTGPALGLTTEATYDELEINLQEGDRILLYTDGLFDIGTQPHTSTDIANLLSKLGEDDGVLEALLHDVIQSEIRPDCDDVTLVLLTAASGDSKFSESSEDFDLAELTPEEEPGIARGQEGSSTFLLLRGRMTWLYGQILFDAGVEILTGGSDLTIDLADCDHMDSTILGTLHELVHLAKEKTTDLHLQNVGEHLIAGFEELAMTSVLERISDQPVAVPASAALSLSASSIDRQQQRLLSAHEALSGLSEANRQEFDSLIETLRSEMDDQNSP